MNDAATFPAFPSIPRLYREVTITEKIDGTNALIHVSDDGTVVRAGSRSRWITTTDDNFGFARWVAEHADELRALGPGSHYGEWYGSGIQRGYGLKEKRFALFNATRWCEHSAEPGIIKQPNPTAPPKLQDKAPACCRVVPVIFRGPFTDAAVTYASRLLRDSGSIAVPGFKNPEGIVVWHEAGRCLFKFTLDGDGHKGAPLAAAG